MTTYVKNLITAGLLLSAAEAFVLPQQITTILNVIQSTIPQIYKGTDSRVGFGFRFGEHADFQVLVELGPQSETRNLGLEESSNSSKRQARQKALSTTTERGKWLPRKTTISGVPQLDVREEGTLTVTMKQEKEGVLLTKNKTSLANNSMKNKHTKTCNTVITCLYLYMQRILSINTK